ncbi:MAG: hypothetical protein ABIM40_01460, partial [Pseudomonadota bacterium]
MKLQRALTILLVLAAAATPVLGWDNVITHPELTTEAVYFLANQNPSYNYVLNYVDFNIATDPQLTFIDEGSVKEDYGLSADWDTGKWGGSQDSDVPYLSWKAHGYEPSTGESWYELPDFANALEQAGDVWTSINSRSNKYFHIGRLCHLMEDMASPAHANADMHADGDDEEEYSLHWYGTISWSPGQIRKPSTDGLSGLTTNNYQNFMKNVAWRTYYMCSYYNGTLIETEGNAQPDGELKRMFPYSFSPWGTGLRYDDGGWFVNDSWRIDPIGYFWNGYGIGNNPDWWWCADGGEPNYFYLENIDSDYGSCDPSIAGNGVAPKVFKVNKFSRLTAGTFSTGLAANTKILAKLYAENLYPMATEWVAGFVSYVLPPDLDADGVADGSDNCVSVYNPGQENADGDALGDACETCDNDPNKTAPGVCGCGVADTDSDSDGTPDCNDGCDFDPDKIVPGICGCGVADTDTDGDGASDCVETCDTDPDKTAPGICGCGTPDTDSDSDGTADCNDGCDLDPLKTAPGICGCGTADTDSDSDGTADCNDLCELDPDKVAPGICGCGVADTDSDSDGTADCNDGCDL